MSEIEKETLKQYCREKIQGNKDWMKDNISKPKDEELHGENKAYKNILEILEGIRNNEKK